MDGNTAAMMLMLACCDLSSAPLVELSDHLTKASSTLFGSWPPGELFGETARRSMSRRESTALSDSIQMLLGLLK